MNKSLTIGVILTLALISRSAYAGPDGAFLCEGNAPYDFLTSDPKTHARYGIERAGAALETTGQGALIAGQGVKAISANGLMLVPNEAADKGWVELRKQGRLLRRIPGWLQEWDAWSAGGREKFTFVIWNGDPDAPLTLKTPKTRYIVDGDGHVLLEKSYEGFTDNENGDPILQFAADGQVLYESVNPLDPVRQRVIFSASDLKPVGEVQAPKGVLMSGLELLSADNGFAIADGKLHHYHGNELTPVLAGAVVPAQTLKIDARSQRVLAQSLNDFVVMDLSGKVLYRLAGSRASRPATASWTDARLGIDGSVGFLRAGDGFVTVLTRASGYAQAKTVPLDGDDWGHVACFTANSAALLVDEKPLLVKF